MLLCYFKPKGDYNLLKWAFTLVSFLRKIEQKWRLLPLLSPSLPRPPTIPRRLQSGRDRRNGFFARNIFSAFVPSLQIQRWNTWGLLVVSQAWCPQLRDHNFSFRIKSWKESGRIILSEVAGRKSTNVLLNSLYGASRCR